jgi:hypothetical protein
MIRENIPKEIREQQDREGNIGFLRLGGLILVGSMSIGGVKYVLDSDFQRRVDALL